MLYESWQEVHVNLIGPWQFKIKENEVTFHALTCIDLVMSLFEIDIIQNTTSLTVSKQCKNLWLSQYPKPNYIVHDNVTEFLGYIFQQIFQRNSIIPKYILAYTPTANAYSEQIHQTVGNVLCIYLFTHQPTLLKLNNFLQNICATIQYTTRISSHRSLLGALPGALVFGSDICYI